MDEFEERDLEKDTIDHNTFYQSAIHNKEKENTLSLVITNAEHASEVAPKRVLTLSSIHRSQIFLVKYEYLRSLQLHEDQGICDKLKKCVSNHVLAILMTYWRPGFRVALHDAINNPCNLSCNVRKRNRLQVEGDMLCIVISGCNLQPFQNISTLCNRCKPKNITRQVAKRMLHML